MGSNPSALNALNNLHYQMLAYSLLSKNLGLPPPGMPQKGEPPPPIEEQRKALGEKLVEAIYQQEQDYRAMMIAKSPETKLKEHLSFLDLLNSHRSHAHASRQQKLLLPDRPPAGLAPETIRMERERRIEKRAQQRLQELENMVDTEEINEDEANEPKKLGALLNERYHDTVRSASTRRIQEIIQLKSLRLRQKQAKVGITFAKTFVTEYG